MDDMNQNEKTKTIISSDGLRYEAKPSGQTASIFGAGGQFSLSCILCGLHRARALGAYMKIAGQRQFVCGDCGKNA